MGAKPLPALEAWQGTVIRANAARGRDRAPFGAYGCGCSDPP